LSQDDAPVLAKAIGAALSDCKGINLLPAHLKDRKKKSFERMIIAGVVILFLGILLSVYSGLTIKKNNAYKQRDNIQKEYEVLLPQVKDFENELFLRKSVQARYCVGGLLKKLSLLPPSVYLTQMDIKDKEVFLSGVVVGKPKEAIDILDRWTTDLQGCVLSSVNIVSKKTMPNKEDATEFKISGVFFKGVAP